MDAPRIGILGYDGVTAINVVNVLEIFALASTLDGIGRAHKCYDPVTIGFDGERFVSESGIAFTAHYSIRDAPAVDTLIIPGGSGLRDEAKGRQVAEWVKGRARSTRRIASVCTGIYGVAPSGLLDGRRVTTHWECARDVAERFPKVRLEESELYIKDDRFYSSAGATAGIDLALALITEDFGREVSLPVAQRFLVYLERDGGQEQYSPPVEVTGNAATAFTNLSTDRMGKLLRWITQHLSADLSLQKLAAKALLSKRELLVQFRETFGAPPGLFVKNLRLNEGRCRLLRGETPCKVAKSLRFQNPVYFIQEFRRRFGALPDDYQRRFSSIDRSKTKSTPNTNEREWTSPSSRSQRTEGYRRPKIVSFTKCVRRHGEQADESRPLDRSSTLSLTT
jgi:transcriptional regulator GlxA family with amidase domain